MISLCFLNFVLYSLQVKAKPDEGKKKEAKEKTPEAEQSKSESSEKDDDNKVETLSSVIGSSTVEA